MRHMGDTASHTGQFLNQQTHIFVGSFLKLLNLFMFRDHVLKFLFFFFDQCNFRLQGFHRKFQLLKSNFRLMIT